MYVNEGCKASIYRVETAVTHCHDALLGTAPDFRSYDFRHLLLNYASTKSSLNKLRFLLRKGLVQRTHKTITKAYLPFCRVEKSVDRDSNLQGIGMAMKVQQSALGRSRRSCFGQQHGLACPLHLCGPMTIERNDSMIFPLFAKSFRTSE